MDTSSTAPQTPDRSGKQLLVSVVLPTYNRQALLREAIESLWQQTLDPASYEIVIVDNCSTDGTEGMLQEMLPKAPCRTSYHRNEYNIGPFANFNKAVELSRAPIVALTDSDCRIASDWLEKGLAAFERNPKIAFVSGRIMDKPEQRVSFLSLRNGAPEGENPFYPAGNCFYRRDIYLALGGMDLEMSFREIGGGPNGCGDTDLAWRMKEQGYEYACSDEAIVYHEVKYVTLKQWLMHHTRIFPLPFLLRRHPGMKNKLLAWGPFLYIDNALFYLEVIGAISAILVHPLALLLTIPFVSRCVRVPGKPFSIARLPVLAGRVVLLSLRQAVLCGALICGSLRARTLVM